MVRENWHIYEIPELWRRRKEAGLCPACGKEKSQFAKGRKVYCSTECADIVAEKFQTWASLRDSIIEENPVCSVCGITREKFEERKAKKLNEGWKALEQKYAKEIEEEKLRQLQIREEMYMREIARIEEASHEDFWIQRLIEVLEGGRAKIPNEYWKPFEVDHIIPISKGGAMWDKKNLRVLCFECHKKKTKNDYKLEERRDKYGKLEGEHGS